MRNLAIVAATLIGSLTGLGSLGADPQAPGTSPTAPAFVVGQREYLDSKVLGERREILVSVPSVAPGTKLPLLVALDGGAFFRPLVTITEHLRRCGRLPPVVVAGVVNTNRGRDMIPGFEGSEFAAEDSAGRFLTFLTEELPPFVAERHPISDYRILAGHSNAGAFTLQAFIRKPGAFKAYLVSSPSSGDERIPPLLARTLSKPGLGSRFLFLSVGDEEGDIALGAVRFAKTIEENLPASLVYRYEYFPGEDHASVTLKAYCRGLELLGAADPPVTAGPERYLSKMQRRETTWIRRFGAGYGSGEAWGEKPPLVSAARPLMDELSETGPDGLPTLWQDLSSDYARRFRFDAVDFVNLLAYLEASGRHADAAALRGLPGFVRDTKDAPLNNYGASVDLKAGLAAHVAADGAGTLRDLANPSTQIEVHGAVPCAGRQGREGRAYSFDGKATYIQISGNPALQTAGSLTVSAWIRPRTPATYTAWVSQPRSVGWGSKWRLGFGGAAAAEWGATTLGVRWTDYWTKKAAIPTNRWSHTAAVFDQTLGTIALYLDGRLVEGLWGLTPWNASSGPLLIGAQRDDGLFYDGDVGEVRVYNRTLSAAEIAALHSLE